MVYTDKLKRLRGKCRD